MVTLLPTEDDLCPVAALLTWLVCRRKSPDPLFCLQSGVPLTQSRLVTELRKTLSDLELEADQFAGHSFRRSGSRHPRFTNKDPGTLENSAFQQYLEPLGSHTANLVARLSQASSDIHPSVILRH